ncbi:MAG: dihydroneopterin aldolase [Clostridiales bacterium]|nr:dihydroneopterin aldolase [Clostridiales bacterium]
MAIIRMCDMEFYGYTGCLPEEKENGQVFIVSVVMECPGLEGCITDRLEDTVDYSKVYDTVKKTTERSDCNLIEFLANEIARKVLRVSDRIGRVTVTVSKPDAPIDGIFRTMEAEVTLDA